MKLLQGSQLLVLTIFLLVSFLNESSCAPATKGLNDAYNVTLKNASYIPGIFTTGLLVIPFTPAQQVLVNAGIISNTSVITGNINPIYTPSTTTTASATNINLAAVTNPFTINPNIITEAKPDISTNKILPVAETKPTSQDNQAYSTLSMMPGEVIADYITTPTSEDIHEDTVLTQTDGKEPSTEAVSDNITESITEENQEGGISENEKNTESTYKPTVGGKIDENTALASENNPIDNTIVNYSSLLPEDKQVEEGAAKVSDNNPTEDKTIELTTDNNPIEESTISGAKTFPIGQEQTTLILQNNQSDKPKIMPESVPASTAEDLIEENTVLTPHNHLIEYSSISEAIPFNVPSIATENTSNENTVPISPDSQKEKTTLTTQQNSSDGKTPQSEDETLAYDETPINISVPSPEKVMDVTTNLQNKPINNKETTSETLLMEDTLSDVTSVTTDTALNENTSPVSPDSTEQNTSDGNKSPSEDKTLISDEVPNNKLAILPEKVIGVTSNLQNNPTSDGETASKNPFIENENTDEINNYSTQFTESESLTPESASFPVNYVSSSQQNEETLTEEHNKSPYKNTENYISAANNENHISETQINTEEDNVAEYPIENNNNLFHTIEPQITPVENVSDDTNTEFDNDGTYKLGIEDSASFLDAAELPVLSATTNSATPTEEYAIQESDRTQPHFSSVVQSSMEPAPNNNGVKPANLYGSYSDGTNQQDDYGNTNHGNSNSWVTSNSYPTGNSGYKSSYNSEMINQYKPINEGGQGYTNEAIQYGSNYGSTSSNYASNPSKYGENTDAYTPYKYNQGLNTNTGMTYSQFSNPSYTGTKIPNIGVQTMYNPSYTSGSINPSYISSPTYSYSQPNYPGKTSYVVAPMKTGYHQLPLVPAKIYKPAKAFVAIPTAAQGTSPIAAVPVSSSLASQSLH